MMQVEEDPGDISGQCGHSDQPPTVCSGPGPTVASSGFERIRRSTVVRPQDGDRADLGFASALGIVPSCESEKNH